MTARIFRVLAVGTLLLCAFVRPARADEESSRVAQALFDEGRKLLEAGHYAQACAKLKESQRLDPGGGTLLNLALCNEKEGKIATAWSEFNEALSLALKDGRRERQAFARSHIESLEKEIPRLVLLGSARDAVVSIDKTAVDMTALSGVSIPLDPGAHIVSTALGTNVKEISFTLARGETKTIALNEILSGANSATPDASDTRTVPSTDTPRAVTESGSSTKSIHTRPPAFYLLFAGSAASLLTSGVTGAFALNKDAEARSKCIPDRNYCPDPTSVDDRRQASTLAWISTASLGLGLVLAVTAFAWPTTVTPALRASPGQASMAWTF